LRPARCHWRAKQFAEKLPVEAPGAKALIEKKDFIAALKALRRTEKATTAPLN